MQRLLAMRALRRAVKTEVSKFARFRKRVFIFSQETLLASFCISTNTEMDEER